jgi:hypothetical protein
LGIERWQSCIERALPCPEYVASIAPKDLADTIATVAGFANAILGERQDGGNGLLTSQVTLVLQSFRTGQKSGLIVVAPIAARIGRIDLRKALKKAELAFSIRCHRSATWMAQGFSRST